jgi:hypothetical protein
VNVDGLRQVVQEIVVLAEITGLSRNDRRHVTTGNVGHQWNQLMTDPIPLEAGVGVAGIVHHRETERRTQGFGVAPAQVEKRLGVVEAHAREAFGGGTPHQVHQDGFGLVVGGVPGENTGGHECLSVVSGTGLKVGSIGKIGS